MDFRRNKAIRTDLILQNQGLDYIIPSIGTKRFGGTRAGIIGTSIGLVIGLLAPIPGGIIICPFIGAFLGELINKSNSKKVK